jgi:hypothetical protein
MTSLHDRSKDKLSTSGDYEREAEHTRRRLADNLDELSKRLTPGQVFDEMLTYSRAGGGTFLSAFSNAMRENPLPSLMIGAGCMMFLSEKMGLRYGRGGGGQPRAGDDVYRPSGLYGTSGATSRVSEAADRLSDSASRASGAAGRMAGAAASSTRATAAAASSRLKSAAEAVQGKASAMAGVAAETARRAASTVGETMAGAADAAGDTALDLRDQASGAMEQMRRGVQTAAGSVRNSAASMRDAAAEAVSDTAASVRDTAASMSGSIADTTDRRRRRAADAFGQGRESAVSFIAEQPLLCAAIGMAVGSALASMLPSTDAEDKLMGERSDAVKGAAQRAGSDALDSAVESATNAAESAKNVASKVADRVQTAAKEEGLSLSAVADAAHNLSEQIGKGAQGLSEKVGKGIQGAVSQPITGTAPQLGRGGSTNS